MRTILAAFLVALVASPAAAQTVTVTSPGAPPATFDCSVAPGCAIAVAPAVVEPPPPPPPCTWSLAPVNLSFDAVGGTQGLTVTPSRDGCGPFTTDEDVEWLVLNGSSVTALANANLEPRTATVRIAGQVVTVTQAAATPPPPPPPPQTTAPIFRMDCAKGWPRCGFDYAYTEREGTHFRRERLAGQAPSGRDAVRLTLLPASGQFEWGWIYILRQAVPQGRPLFLRWRFRPVSPIAWGGSARRAGGKFVILGNLCEKSPFSPTRVISNIEAPSNQFLLRTEQNINGAPSRFDVTSGIQADRWHHVELKAQSSSSATATDGLLTMTLDGRVVGQSSGGFNLKTAGWSTVAGCGDSGIAFGNTFNPLAAGQHFVLDVADFEVDDKPDPEWGRR